MLDVLLFMAGITAIILFIIGEISLVALIIFNIMEFIQERRYRK